MDQVASHDEFRTLKALQLQCAQVTLGTRHESRCTDNTSLTSRIIDPATPRHTPKEWLRGISRAVNDNTKIANNSTPLDPRTTGVTQRSSHKRHRTSLPTQAVFLLSRGTVFCCIELYTAVAVYEAGPAEIKNRYNSALPWRPILVKIQIFN